MSESEQENIHQSMKIVVVDDSEFSRTSMVEVLESQGYNVVGQAGNGQEALKIGASSNANVYIIDVVMPETSGVELAKIIQENFQGVYVIMVSSLNMEHVMIECLSSGAVDFLPKPFDATTLLRSIEKLEKRIEND